ncbi:hypothetical protein [Dactylosporangium sp. NPDC051484]|uniref:hypothetical protein n=1 Tax=Dactylosporangium sp. NPDC051484 TaxID=3154942 RepID=UPI00344E1920
MAVQDEREDTELQLEVALALLPLIGRCVRLEDGRAVRHQGNRLDDAQDRRALVREVARRWSTLKPNQRRRYPGDRGLAIVEFTAEYVDDVEHATADEGDYRGADYDASLEVVWRQHVEAIRQRDEAA